MRDGVIGKWFDIWFEDKQGILQVMRENMAADLNAGYDPDGKSIREQIEEYKQYKEQFEAKLDEFAGMDDKRVDRWCYYDLKKRGAI